MSTKKEEGDKSTANDTGNSSDELTTVVEGLLNNLSSKFNTVSSEMFAKMDEMSRRLDNLEAALRANEEKAPGSPSKS